MAFSDPGHGWRNRPTWALVCWLHAYCYSYLMEVSFACWRVGQEGLKPGRRARGTPEGKALDEYQRRKKLLSARR